jgi:hypothetical protein
VSGEALSPLERQIRARRIMAALGLLWVLAITASLFLLPAYRTGKVSTHGSVHVSSSGTTTVFHEAPVPVLVILSVCLAAWVIGYLSLRQRIRSHSARRSVPATVTAVVMGVAALAGTLTIGPVLWPLAVLLFLVALPLDRFDGELTGRDLTGP